MIFVPSGYAYPGLFDNSVVHGGSAWGPTTIAGSDGSRQPNEIELENVKATVSAGVDGRGVRSFVVDEG
jgi:multimeric flavodoxin WrbA